LKKLRRVERAAALFALAGLLSGGPVRAQEGAAVEIVRLIDSPTAGLIAKGSFGVDLRFFPSGGVLGQLNAGVLDRLTIGLSFGGEQIIGAQDVEWYPRVEPAIRYRLIEESSALPALALGYETQGYGTYLAGRYQIKSKGVFLALSKNYTSALGQFGVHGGLNLSREGRDVDRDLSGWVGLDKSVNEELSLVAEYDLGLNDNSRAAIGSGEGYLNAGVHWNAVENLSLGFLLKNILGNGDADPQMSRELSVRYIEDF